MSSIDILSRRRKAVLLFGDSLTQRSFEPSGWGASMANWLVRRCDVYNRGYGGYNSRWAKYILQDMLLPSAPKINPYFIATVMLGTNDASIDEGLSDNAFVPLDEYERNMEDIITLLKAHCTHVFVLTPPCMDEKQRLEYQVEAHGDKATGVLDRTNENTAKYADVCKKVAEKMSVASVDLFHLTTVKMTELQMNSITETSQEVEPQLEVTDEKGKNEDESLQSELKLLLTQLRASDEPEKPVTPLGTASNKSLFIDGIHFNEEGQELVFEALRKAIGGVGVKIEDDSEAPLDYPLGLDLKASAGNWEHVFQKARKQKKTSKDYMAVPPTLISSLKLEYSVHNVLPRMKQDLKAVFPEIDIDKLLIIPTFQSCNCDLVAIGVEAESEKDRLLKSFVEFGKKVCGLLREKQHWADLTDPCSGYPVIGERGSGLYPDVNGSWMLLRYDLIETGCCKLISHPKWGTKVYPATMFTTAPLDVVQSVMETFKDATP
eukprot:m.216756 g.216756  ORF g.216756 m.216756 type:complete len:491 (+) comp15881_c0_seq9:1318-2790(+)